MHKPTPKPAKKAQPEAKAQHKVGACDGDDGVLKLTVSMVAYNAMTADVGERGRKKKECRLDKDWVRQRLDGRKYVSVKLYGGTNIFDDNDRWTLFECEGIRKVGKEGSKYTVECFGDEEGFICIMHGVVWEILLGKVLARHVPVQGPRVVSQAKTQKPVREDSEVSSADEGTDEDADEVPAVENAQKKRKVVTNSTTATDKVVANSTANASSTANTDALASLADRQHKQTCDIIDKITTHDQAMMDKIVSMFNAQQPQAPSLPPSVPVPAAAAGIVLNAEHFMQLMGVRMNPSQK